MQVIWGSRITGTVRDQKGNRHVEMWAWRITLSLTCFFEAIKRRLLMASQSKSQRHKRF